jgi:hypothetical protein
LIASDVTELTLPAESLSQAYTVIEPGVNGTATVCPPETKVFQSLSAKVLLVENRTEVMGLNASVAVVRAVKKFEIEFAALLFKLNAETLGPVPSTVKGAADSTVVVLPAWSVAMIRTFPVAVSVLGTVQE